VYGPAFNDPPPLAMMALALRERLQAAFPPAQFDFAFAPAKADKVWFKKYLRRGPGVALSWNGCQGTKDDGGVWEGTAHWSVLLFTKNGSGVLERYMGDALAPGLFAMTRVATLILHGWLINPSNSAWSAQGACVVNAMGNTYNDEWGDEDTAVSALDLTVLYDETLPPGLEAAPSAAFLQDNITWNFGEQPPLLTQSVQTGVS
jgi:hypothetical protein